MIKTKTAYDLVFLALREIGVVSLGDTPDANVMNEGLLVLNTIRAEWSINTKNYIYFDQVYTALTNKTHITLGTSLDLLTVGDIPNRPQSIDQVTIIQGLPGTPINYPIPLGTYEEYRNIPITDIGAIPRIAFPDTAYPIQNLWLYPEIQPGWSIRIMGSSYLTEYEALANPYMDPPEYFSALYLSLALRMAPKYGIDANQGVLEQARGAMAKIKTNLFTRQMKRMSNGLVSGNSGFNFYAGM